jgi:hypothetical protein
MKIEREQIIKVSTNTKRGVAISIRGGAGMFHLDIGKNKDMGFYADELNDFLEMFNKYKEERNA